MVALLTEFGNYRAGRTGAPDLKFTPESEPTRECRLYAIPHDRGFRICMCSVSETTGGDVGEGGSGCGERDPERQSATAGTSPSPISSGFRPCPPNVLNITIAGHKTVPD